ncbi:hypothetical protein [Mucilaginibacter sp. PAMB04168]|uniref:hypothetical protein n=1 Tax=Mucilaginibacter sp. PAMB04168 TaxID=3138567 RepID=UPI0031F713DC
MMKKITLVFTLLVIVVIACKKDKTNNKIIGRWETEGAPQLAANHIHEFYLFDKQGKYYLTRMVQDPNSSNYLGYLQYTSGRYRLQGNTILFYNKESYINDPVNGPYASRDKLVKANDPDASANFTIESNGLRRLAISSICSPNAFCVEITSRYQFIADED